MRRQGRAVVHARPSLAGSWLMEMEPLRRLRRLAVSVGWSPCRPSIDATSDERRGARGPHVHQGDHPGSLALPTPLPSALFGSSFFSAISFAILNMYLYDTPYPRYIHIYIREQIPTHTSAERAGLPGTRSQTAAVVGMTPRRQLDRLLSITHTTASFVIP